VKLSIEGSEYQYLSKVLKFRTQNATTFKERYIEDGLGRYPACYSGGR
jgi:hypothetical protein